MIHHALRHFRGLRNHHHYLFIDRTQQYNNAAFVGKIVRLKTYLINAFRPIRTRASEIETYGVTALGLFQQPVVHYNTGLNLKLPASIACYDTGYSAC